MRVLDRKVVLTSKMLSKKSYFVVQDLRAQRKRDEEEGSDNKEQRESGVRVGSSCRHKEEDQEKLYCPRLEISGPDFLYGRSFRGRSVFLRRRPKLWLPFWASPSSILGQERVSFSCTSFPRKEMRSPLIIRSSCSSSHVRFWAFKFSDAKQEGSINTRMVIKKKNIASFASRLKIDMTMTIEKDASKQQE